MGSYVRPGELSEALQALKSGTFEVVAGGTDYFPARVGRPLDDDVLDITGLAELRGIRDLGESYLIGALTTWTDLIRAPLPPYFDGLKLAAREIGGAQIQNAGTLCGNICNASPAADGVPPLMALDAEVELASAAGGERSMPVAEFILGNRLTDRRRDELVTGISVPKMGANAHGTFLKLGARRYLVISIVMVAAVIEAGADGTVADARIAVGACAPVARRLRDLERELVGRPADATLGAVAAPGHIDESLSPIDDVRGTAAYRRDATVTLVRRALETLGARRAEAA